VAGAAASPTAEAAAAASPAAGPAAGSAATFPLALVAPVDDLRTGYTSAQVRSLVAAGKVLVPCGVATVTAAGEAVAAPAGCTKATSIPVAVRKTPSRIALLPAGLVDPRVKVLTVDGADLFGNTVVRARAYPVTGTSDALPAELAGPATLYDADDVRTVVSTGDTCPDRSVSLWAVVKGKGWDWTLQGGTARYTGTYMDRRFDGPTGNGWEVVKAVRTGKGIGAVWSMIHDADIAVNDFECPMVADFTQHESGTFFTIDPEVAGLMRRVGMDVLSLASNHITDLDSRGVLQTVAYADNAGVKHAGAGKDLAAAMAPAIVDVRGLRFAILSWDATRQATPATGTTAGAMRATTGAVKKAVANARKKADVVIAMPQWNWPEYSAAFSATAQDQRDAWYAAGVDHILGSGTHWASGISITRPDPAKGWRLAVTSHGNFLFGQDWSRQTQEGVIYEATFRGTDLVQVRLHPYIVLDGAQPNLTASKTDGAFVQRQVFRASDLP
jgi:poly-gamma-glutamate capsule biosynthesis protein CapA/YwtB (metallophosphatase superfamily)